MSDTVRTNASGESQNADRGIAPPGFRLPAATRLGVVRLQIANLTRSLAYYERVLGFRTLRRTEGIGFVFFEDVDVVRHTLVQRIVRAYERYNQQIGAGRQFALKLAQPEDGEPVAETPATDG